MKLLGRGLAELLVIVAGVLIALWIEGWREARVAAEGWSATTDTLDVLTAYHLAGFINFIRLRRTTWDDLVSTGNVDLIQDADVRRRLGAYYRSVALEFLVEMDDNRKEHIWYRYRPALESHFPMGFLNGLRPDEPERSLPDIDFAALREDPAVRSGLRSAAGMSEVYLRQLRALAEENGEVLSMVRGADA